MHREPIDRARATRLEAARDVVGASLSAALFSAQWVIVDLLARGTGAYVGASGSPRAWLAAVESSAIGYLLWTLRGRGAWRLVLGTLAGALVVSEWLFFRYYHATLDAQAVAAAAHSWGEVKLVIAGELPRALPHVAIAALVECALLARRTVRPPRWPAVVALAAAAPFAAPLAESTPELRIADALTLLWRPGDAAAATSGAGPGQKMTEIPRLRSTRRELPSVLFILTESVRDADYCTAHDAPCLVSPEIDALLPDRVPLREMRAVASYTAVSVSALIRGRTQEGSRAEIVEAPTVFDLLHAVHGAPSAPSVAYWSAQSEAVFEKADVRRAIDSFVTLETLLGHAVEDEDTVVDRGIDRMLAAYFTRALPSLPAPAFTMLHFSGTHAPYFVDDSDAPFQPSRHEVTWSGLPALHGAYLNAIREQDRSVAACVRAFLADRGARPWVIVMTSDHGEAFGEHGAIHHGQSLYDEQLHVPGFIAHGGGALDPEEDRNLRAYERRFVTHLDVLPTLLDVYGVLDGFALAPVRATLAGRSLIAPPRGMAAPLPITNCTALFPCPISTWGMMMDARAIVAQPWDTGFHCLDLAARAAELTPTDPSCAALRASSRRYFPRLPSRDENR
jgi:hypothetical protein